MCGKLVDLYVQQNPVWYNVKFINFGWHNQNETYFVQERPKSIEEGLRAPDWLRVTYSLQHRPQLIIELGRGALEVMQHI